MGRRGSQRTVRRHDSLKPGVESRVGSADSGKKAARQGGGKASCAVREILHRDGSPAVREFIKKIVEGKATEVLAGRSESQRRATVPGESERYRNGYGKPRTLALSSGTVTVCRSLAREAEERFETRVLPFFARRVRVAPLVDTFGCGTSARRCRHGRERAEVRACVQGVDGGIGADGARPGPVGEGVRASGTVPRTPSTLTRTPSPGSRRDCS